MAMLSFCGVDVSKDRLDVVVPPEGWFFSVSNDPAAFFRPSCRGNFSPYFRRELCVRGTTSSTVFAEDARQLTCSGMMIEPSAMSQSPETVILTLGPAQKVALDLGQGVVNARKVSDNKIQLKFRTKDFEGEYFHYTGDLFFIYKSGHLMKLTCQKRES